MSQADTINRMVLDGLLESVGDDREFLDELLQTYFDDSPQLLGTMRSALVAGDAQEFRQAAHSLKSNSATFGALAFSAQAREIEMMAKEGDLGGGQARIASLTAEYPRVQQALRELQNGS